MTGGGRQEAGRNRGGKAGDSKGSRGKKGCRKNEHTSGPAATAERLPGTSEGSLVPCKALILQMPSSISSFRPRLPPITFDVPGTIVAGEDDDCVVGSSRLFQSCHDAAHGGIEFAQSITVDGVRGGRPVEGREEGVWRVHVWHRVVEKERSNAG